MTYMKCVKILVIALTFLILDVNPAQAVIKKVAQTGLQFLKIDMSARAAAMGGAFTMPGRGASAVMYNPAGLAEMNSNFDFFITRTNWISETSLNGGALAKNLGNWGNIGIDYISMDYGELIGTQVASNSKGFVETGNVNVGAYAVGLGYARQFTDKYFLGAHIKYASQHLGSNVLKPGEDAKKNQVSGIAYDIGTIFYPGFKSFRLGMSVRDFSPQLKYEETPFQLPLTFRIGVAMDVLDLLGNIPNNSLLISIDALHPRDYTERVHIGGEYTFSNILALRAGYKTNYDEEGLSLGFGLNWEIAGINLKIDYAYTDFGVFQNVNRFSIGGSF